MLINIPSEYEKVGISVRRKRKEAFEDIEKGSYKTFITRHINTASIFIFYLFLTPERHSTSTPQKAEGKNQFCRERERELRGSF
jgi:hypothetical protein